MTGLRTLRLVPFWSQIGLGSLSFIKGEVGS